MLIKASFAEQLGLSWEQQNLEESATSCGSTAASKKLPRARLGQHLTLAYTGLRSQSHIQRKKSEGKNQTLMRRIHLVLFFHYFCYFFFIIAFYYFLSIFSFSYILSVLLFLLYLLFYSPFWLLIVPFLPFIISYFFSFCVPSPRFPLLIHH